MASLPGAMPPSPSPGNWRSCTRPVGHIMGSMFNSIVCGTGHKGVLASLVEENQAGLLPDVEGLNTGACGAHTWVQFSPVQHTATPTLPVSVNLSSRLCESLMCKGALFVTSFFCWEYYLCAP